MGIVLDGVIGKGGMARVYAGRHDTWGDIAVKVLRPDARVRHRRRFVEEIRVLSAFRHPRVVRVFAAGESDGQAWIAMERVHGGSWFAEIKQGGAQPVAVAAPIVLDVLEGLGALHEAGIVHRDVKPQNVLIDEEGVAKLCDFGIARADLEDRPDLTRTGDRLGTLSYMPPEQRANPRAVDGRTDLYALGASLYVALTAKKAPDLSLSEFRPELLDRVPPPMRPVIDRATRYDPNKRYATAREMARAIGEVLTAGT